MKSLGYLVITICIMLGFAVAGCGAQKAESPRAAIDVAKTMQTAQEKTDYLISQAKAFYNSKDFQGAVDIAQYVLRYLDKDSQAAKDLLTKAKEQLTAQAQGMLDQAKKDFKVK
jgi:alkyl sulfatase BDS1-like metallo-beta-lactamase superfamily hydrolase